MTPLEEALATIKDCMEWALQQREVQNGPDLLVDETKRPA